MDSTFDVSEHWEFYLPEFTLPLDFIPFGGRQLFDYSKPSPQVVRNPQGARKRLFPSVLNTEDIQKGHAAYESLFNSVLIDEQMSSSSLIKFTGYRSQHAWELKVFDDEIVARWRTEVSQNTTLDISEQMFNYVIAEVRHKALIFSETGAVTVYHGDVVRPILRSRNLSNFL
ncbi:uncharacterized protein BDW43DRAFT_316653 [Aspergillus alliaceus]|uniref:uncharacterized protein n=1 Tax=Petromyces alliaceus TaxID=209559 RepID=UPI0012A551F3|nr:uncharacterized protein BDW43DRAFT_316653 [Aspergillus alliaceus]KAB8227600.1 hypothetical protein BDW43DRAFT_316653 [Aspergillus alliaceus]